MNGIRDVAIEEVVSDNGPQRSHLRVWDSEVCVLGAGDRKSNCTAAGVMGNLASKKGTLQGHSSIRRQPAGRKPPFGRALSRAFALLAGGA